jgi:hypothetical protein
MAIFDVPKPFSRQWVQRKVPQMDSTEFHAMFHEAATRGWDEDELRQLAAIRAPLPLRQAAIDGNAKLQSAAWQPALPL